MTTTSDIAAIKAKKKQILDLDLDLDTLRNARRNARSKMQAERSSENRITYMALNAIVHGLEHGGAV